MGAMHVLACADKFRGTLTAPEFGEAVAAGAEGHEVVIQPLADGGEGTLDAFGGPNRRTTVTGPLGDPIDAAWRLSGGRAVIEMARASGLSLVGGADGNDPLEATTAGTGELIAKAVEAGAREIIVGLGGSATTDGGLGALRALPAPSRLRGVDLVVACDVETRFTDAAQVFGPQKGATAAQIRLLTARLERLVDVYRSEHGTDVADVVGGGAAGGLAGGLVAAGARLESGAALIADAVDLYDKIESADLVVTGEGRVDATSFDGKVVGAVIELAAAAECDVLVIGGRIDDEARQRLDHLGVAWLDLVAAHGETTAMTATADAVTVSISDVLSR
ncbi:MAG TPA: glycerate kinase [Acidimicrobiaceae bacterium]|nr:glycerate kinase [Acidimicrobiaceae bacterium]|tara:strand:- start:1176 stop:2177 length:1002 start_codon:yes stop_codon:yes gene_type:complete